jgi:hypothetical protein
MINPAAFSGINPIRNANPLGAANSLNGNTNGNALAPVGDGSQISPEAQGQDGDLSQMMQQMMEAFGMGQEQQSPEQKIEQLKKEIAQTEQQLGQAQQNGDEEAIPPLTQKLEGLKAELAQLTGQGAGQEGGAPGGGGGEAPAAGGGGGAPAGGGGGGAPAGGGGGGAPAGGGGGGAPAGGGGGGAPAGGGGGGGGAAPVGGNNGAADNSPVNQTNQVPPELAGDDKKMAEFIEGKLAGTPLAGKGLGSHFVAAGKQNGVDPLVLASISKHETNHGKLGVGTRKHMGVGAFDASPNKARKWDGAVNQIYSGARTFSNLRKKYGSSANAPLSQQLRAVNGNGTRSGWATDTGWHNKVAKTYNSYASSAKSFAGSNTSRVASSTPKVSTTKKA